MAKSIKTKSAMPIRHSSHIKETDSRAVLEKAIKPWMIISWIEKDYGIDGIIEITQDIRSSQNQIVTGKRFSLQLKATETIKSKDQNISLSVPREKINYWYNAIEPVIIVLVDLHTSTCFYRHIDDKLIEELTRRDENWIAQDSITIKFEKDLIFNPQQLLAIEEYIIHWRRPSKVILSPGNYFKYSKEIVSYINELADNARQLRVPFFSEKIAELVIHANHAIYTIAIAGPSRAGKSTLINALLRQNISPVGILPTTGLPISIYPNNRNQSEIIFKNGKKITGPVDSSFLQEYTSQDTNPDNIKGVSMVSVNVVNVLLEKGFVLRDVPGLDDPDEDIRTITRTALYSANAIVYVINTGSMEDGGFSFTKQIIDDLKELGSQMDRLFIVFNKVDKLNAELQKQLREYVDFILEKYKIAKYLPSPPIYISAKQSLTKRLNKESGKDSVTELEDLLWEYLLSQNKTGLNKLLGIYADTKKTIEQLKTVLDASLLNADRRREIEEEILSIQKEIPQLAAFVHEQKSAIEGNLRKVLNDSFSNLITYLQNDLNSIPITNALHSNEVISNWLRERAQVVFSYMYEQLEDGIFRLQTDVNSWVSGKLKQLEIQISPDTISSSCKMPDVSNHLGHISYNLQAFTPYNGGVLEGLFAGIEKVIDKIVVYVEQLLMSEEKTRQRQINEIVKNSHLCYKKAGSSFVTNLKRYLHEICRVIEEKSMDRANVYLNTLSNQLSKLDNSISNNERANYQAFLQYLLSLEQNISRDYIYLEDYTHRLSSSQ